MPCGDRNELWAGDWELTAYHAGSMASQWLRHSWWGQRMNLEPYQKDIKKLLLGVEFFILGKLLQRKALLPARLRALQPARMLSVAARSFS